MMNITEMRIEDYAEVRSLWEKSDGVSLHEDDDSEKGITKYLKRNPGFSVVARENGKIVGAVLCGHDGRRGYLHHLAVEAAFRRQGIGEALVKQALSRLWTAGIGKCHIFILADNIEGDAFWQRIGWSARTDLKLASKSFDVEHFCN